MRWHSQADRGRRGASSPSSCPPSWASRPALARIDRRAEPRLDRRLEARGIWTRFAWVPFHQGRWLSEASATVVSVTWSPGTALEDWRDAEALATWHFRERLGYPDAHPTPPGPDGGIDVIASSAHAQVKFELKRASRPKLQQLAGTQGSASELQLIFYARAGFTRPAHSFARRRGIALFLVRDDGVVAANDIAELLLATAPERYTHAMKRRPHWGSFAATYALLLCPIMLGIIDPEPFERAVGAISLATLPFAWWSLRQIGRDANERPASAGWGQSIQQLYYPSREPGAPECGHSWESKPWRLRMAVIRRPGEPSEVVLTARLRWPWPRNQNSLLRRELELKRLDEKLQDFRAKQTPLRKPASVGAQALLTRGGAPTSLRRTTWPMPTPSHQSDR